ncbi:CDP-alcohol phosphatidyltransferase family protein [Alphaproteobacteria bacterium]|nr:CDP-alcohol phosphatidyltransferase family protein [Alphaproteobacteria bacterium]MDB4234553.1 CDP-alcohol phosphatidyltransferase family protein [Alphaproteobacteria bacterium]|tara:strand:- start:221 stop:850 length:630 start_codon:yes stop_codon:yes gene_type:complete
MSKKSILSFIKDLPNICSLMGLVCSILAIYFMFIGIYQIAMIGMIWAVGFDWADGIIARNIQNRTKEEKIFGGQLDLLIDIVSYGVAPAILILSYSNFNPLFLLPALIMLIFGVMRLSYFSTFGLSEEAKYTGLAIDNNSIVLVFIFLFSGYFDKITFSILLGIVGVFLAILNISNIKTPKLSGNPINVFILSFYILIITTFYIYSFYN